MYEIQTKSDMLTGTTLMITIPEADLDKKALYTLQATTPDFILPFHTRYVDGFVEISYQVKTLCKLQYMVGVCATNEYVQLWSKILSPLLECGDWFLKTQSFVYDINYLYCDKDKKIVSYVYIPTIHNYADCDDIKKMLNQLTKQISVNDAALENKVLRAIMNDFEPKSFLTMLNQYMPEVKSVEVTPVPNPRETVIESSSIEIQLKELDTSLGKQKVYKEKKDKKSKKSKWSFRNTQSQPPPLFEPPIIFEEDTEDSYDDVTEFIRINDTKCGFRLIGSTLLPKAINVKIEDGEVFTIGRYDATVGKPQSDFEFERKTKAISRRHAAVERHLDDYCLIDLSSNTGTYIDGKKLPPSTPVPLINGAHVSFGTAGADYIWEI